MPPFTECCANSGISSRIRLGFWSKIILSLIVRIVFARKLKLMVRLQAKFSTGLSFLPEFSSVGLLLSIKSGFGHLELLWFGVSGGMQSLLIQLQNRGVSIASRCRMCNPHREDVNDIFLSCAKATSVWRMILHWFHLPWPCLNSATDFLMDLCAAPLSK